MAPTLRTARRDAGLQSTGAIRSLSCRRPPNYPIGRTTPASREITEGVNSYEERGFHSGASSTSPPFRRWMGRMWSGLSFSSRFGRKSAMGKKPLSAHMPSRKKSPQMGVTLSGDVVSRQHARGSTCFASATPACAPRSRAPGVGVCFMISRDAPASHKRKKPRYHVPAFPPQERPFRRTSPSSEGT